MNQGSVGPNYELYQKWKVLSLEQHCIQWFTKTDDCAWEKCGICLHFLVQQFFIVSLTGDRFRQFHRLHVPWNNPRPSHLVPLPADALLEQKTLQQGVNRNCWWVQIFKGRKNFFHTFVKQMSPSLFIFYADDDCLKRWRVRLCREIIMLSWSWNVNCGKAADASQFKINSEGFFFNYYYQTTPKNICSYRIFSRFLRWCIDLMEVN